MKRTLVIGDIHGGYKALLQVIERAKVTTDDILIFLGDYVDGWSESAETIDFLIDLRENNECVFIRGNHDVWCQNYLRVKEAPDVWLSNGGKSTVESYTSSFDKSKHLDFFMKMKDYHIDENNNLFIHAGFSSMHGPNKEHYSTNFSWDRTLWETAVAMDKHLKKNSELYPKRLLLFNEIYIGHTPTLNYKVQSPMNKANVWNIDTGAAFTGKLSILDIHSKEFWQSDSLPKLYPNEKGRNFYNIKSK
ncbi:metallophosphoesterase family protein [Flavobacterium sp.]|jgi:serine/threonine protein phosphatase 1|uniref:metallophosphoesterase family protein n=1 Tax=Flavobacterium sp. TaxID=239 RepID=UPI0022C775A8|nr:metallophosphoesterase family protein [Flavobacterium sp.]MCZ8089360.1 metallophosphoesterase family protein [Flavobacterium sp.]